MTPSGNADHCQNAVLPLCDYYKVDKTPRGIYDLSSLFSITHHMAQSASIKSPLGFPLIWDNGANPEEEWEQWFFTLKLAVMAKENLKVDKLLRTKPIPADLFYPAMPSLEDQDQTNQKKKQQKRHKKPKEKK